MLQVDTAYVGVAILISVVIGCCFEIFPFSRVSLRGKLVVITGCDSGFGFGCVLQLVNEGAIVVALCYTKEGMDKVIAAGAKHAIRVDLLIESDVCRACTEIKKLVDGDELFAIIHNAGTVAAGFIDFNTMSNYRNVMEVNFFAIVNMNSHLLPLLKIKSVDGAKKRVIIVSSVDGIVSLPGNAPYDASKYAIEAYADALRVEQSFWDIHVSVINPSTMKTPLALSFFETQRKSYDEAMSKDPDANARWKKEWSREWLDEHIKVNSAGLEQIAQEPSVVIKDLMHAVCATTPQFRYLSGTFAKTLFYALWVMPETWSFAFKKSIVNPKPSVLSGIQTDNKL